MPSQYSGEKITKFSFNKEKKRKKKKKNIAPQDLVWFPKICFSARERAKLHANNHIHASKLSLFELWWWWWWWCWCWWWWWCFRSSFKKKLLYKTHHQFATLDSSVVAEEGDGLHQEELPYIHTYIHMYVCMYMAKIMISKQTAAWSLTPCKHYDYIIIRCTLYVHINIPNCWNSKIFNLEL